MFVKGSTLIVIWIKCKSKQLPNYNFIFALYLKLGPINWIKVKPAFGILHANCFLGSSCYVTTTNESDVT